MDKEKWIPLKPLYITEKEVSTLAWDRTIKKHTKAFVLLGLLIVTNTVVWLLPTKMSETLHTVLWFIGFLAWLGAMYSYFNPKYQALKKELLDEWSKTSE